jgi:hypothetical protein
MPRDLESEKATLEGMEPLFKESNNMPNSPPDDPQPLHRLPTYMIEDRFKKMKDLHPYCLLLSQEDLDDCDWLEHAAFEASEAASREKVRASTIFSFQNSPQLPCSLDICGWDVYHYWAFIAAASQAPLLPFQR